MTDLDGNFSLQAAPGQRIQLSYVGYEPLEFSVLQDDPGFAGAQPVYVLFTRAAELGEVLVVGSRGVLGMVMTGTVIKTEEQACLTTAGFRSTDPAVCTPTSATGSYTSYPNPFTDQINVQLPGGDAGALSAQLFNANGQLLRVWPARTYETGEVRMSFPTGDLRLVPGPYILRLTDGRGEPHSLVVLHP